MNFLVMELDDFVVILGDEFLVAAKLPYFHSLEYC